MEIKNTIDLNKYFEKARKERDKHFWKRWKYRMLRLWFWLIGIPYNLKYWWTHKRHKKIYDCEWWSLYYTIALFVLPRLIKYRENLMGYPGSLNNTEEWEEILDKMIYSFDFIVRDEKEALDETKEDSAKIEEGLNLFGKWYRENV